MSEENELARCQRDNVTHHAGCACHEASWRLRLETVENERDELRESIRLTIMENLGLADGDNCTLKRLKAAIGFEPHSEGCPCAWCEVDRQNDQVEARRK